jgi:hypothetical protein
MNQNVTKHSSLFKNIHKDKRGTSGIQSNILTSSKKTEISFQNLKSAK